MWPAVNALISEQVEVLRNKYSLTRNMGTMIRESELCSATFNGAKSKLNVYAIKF